MIQSQKVQFEELFTSFPLGLIILDAEQNLLYMNKQAEKIMHAFNQDIDIMLRHVFGNDDYTAIAESGMFFSKVKKIGQNLFHMQARSLFLHETNNEVTILIFNNLENIKELDMIDSLKRINTELENILESSYDGIILSDKTGRIYRVSKSVERLTGGVKCSDIMGKTAQELENEGYILSQTRKILGKNPLMVTQKLRTGVEIFITSNRVFDEKGEILFNVDNLRNMEELNQLKKNMEEARGLSQRYLTELQELRDRLMEQDKIIIRSAEMKHLMDAILKVSKTDANVLITGDTGVGKEIAAKMIHKMSSRKEGPFVVINCGAIPDTLLESELFGYEAGAFTGARKEGKIGFMEIAKKGSLLMDEIGDLPLGLQVKLLRAIQEQTIYKLGSSVPIKLDLRIMAATNLNLEELVSAGKFRSDLYYRLNVLPLYIPPLRERKEDIIPLAYHFLEKFNKKYSADKFLSLEVCNILEAHIWPGNVRELENLIERLVIICEEKKITKDYLPGSLRNQESDDIYPEDVTSLREAISKLEEKLIRKTLLNYKTKQKAAQALNIDYSTFYRKLKKYNIL